MTGFVAMRPPWEAVVAGEAMMQHVGCAPAMTPVHRRVRDGGLSTGSHTAGRYDYDRHGAHDGGNVNGDISWITNFIWGIADDVLRDLYVRGKYRDVILPMVVLRRLDAVLEPTSAAVVEMTRTLDEQGVVNQDGALRLAAGQSFYNTSAFTMRDLRARTNQQQLRSDFEAYLDGFSPNVQEILDSFEFRHQIPRLSRADALGTLIEKFTDPAIDLSPAPDSGIDNHAMGSIFEELVRRFNEENNEEAGEHWTPRDAVRLMANLVFLPIADEIASGTYLVYDGACGTGGMLTVAEETLEQLARDHGKEVSTHLYGQEINAETAAIAKSDFLLKGGGEAADNLIGGPEHSTLSNDGFAAREFDFMLSNPPYGKSWKSDLERMGGKGAIRDPRFVIQHAGDPEYSLLTRSSDGQMLFLANMLSKMKHGTRLGSRIAEVHNGSSLFTGDAGQGESNIRRWIIENDWLEAIVALPLNMFYNTGIATYVWVLANRKSERRRGRVQLIDATQWYSPLRKNLGNKNCELSESDIARICDAFLGFEESEQSKIFPNAAFGYQKVTVERPLRLRVDLGAARRGAFRDACSEAGEDALADLVDAAAERPRRWAARRLQRIPRATRAAHAYGRPEADGQAKEAAAEQSGRARRGGAPGVEEGAPSRERCGRPTARSVRSHPGRRRARRRVRARRRPARQRAGAAARRRRDRGVHPP